MSYNWKNDGNLSPKSDLDYIYEVIETLTLELQKAPGNIQNLFLCGNRYLDAGKFADAIEDYGRIISHGAAEARVYNNRGICFRGIGDTRKAISDFDEAIKVDPQYRDAFNNRGMALADESNYRDAVEDYNKAIALDPTYWYAFNNRAMSLWAIGEKDKAIQDYEKVKSLLGH